MKDVLEKLIGLVPAYFEALFPLLSGPKRFIATRLADEPSALTQALVFLAASFLIGWLLKLPLNRGEPLLALAADAMFALMVVLAFGAALCLAWRVAGARIELRKFFTVHFYFAGVLLLLQTLLVLGTLGTIRTFDAALYGEMLAAAHSGDYFAFLVANNARMLASPAYRASMVVQLFVLLASLAWIWAGWGAYRQLGMVSRARSAIAGALFVLLCFPAAALGWMMANALVG